MQCQLKEQNSAHSNKDHNKARRRLSSLKKLHTNYIYQNTRKKKITHLHQIADLKILLHRLNFVLLQPPHTQSLHVWSLLTWSGAGYCWEPGRQPSWWWNSARWLLGMSGCTGVPNSARSSHCWSAEGWTWCPSWCLSPTWAGKSHINTDEFKIIFLVLFTTHYFFTLLSVNLNAQCIDSTTRGWLLKRAI